MSSTTDILPAQMSGTSSTASVLIAAATAWITPSTISNHRDTKLSASFRYSRCRREPEVELGLNGRNIEALVKTQNVQKLLSLR